MPNVPGHTSKSFPGLNIECPRTPSIFEKLTVLRC